MNIPVELIAVGLAAVLAAFGWIVRKLIALDKTVNLIAFKVGVLEKDYEELPSLAPVRIDPVRRVQHKPNV